MPKKNNYAKKPVQEQEYSNYNGLFLVLKIIIGIPLVIIASIVGGIFMFISS